MLNIMVDIKLISYICVSCAIIFIPVVGIILVKCKTLIWYYCKRFIKIKLFALSLLIIIYPYSRVSPHDFTGRFCSLLLDNWLWFTFLLTAGCIQFIKEELLRIV